MLSPRVIITQGLTSKQVANRVGDYLLDLDTGARIHLPSTMARELSGVSKECPESIKLWYPLLENRALVSASKTVDAFYENVTVPKDPVILLQAVGTSPTRHTVHRGMFISWLRNHMRKIRKTWEATEWVNKLLSPRMGYVAYCLRCTRKQCLSLVDVRCLPEGRLPAYKGIFFENFDITSVPKSMYTEETPSYSDVLGLCADCVLELTCRRCSKKLTSVSEWDDIYARYVTKLCLECSAKHVALLDIQGPLVSKRSLRNCSKKLFYTLQDNEGAGTWT